MQTVVLTKKDIMKRVNNTGRRQLRRLDEEHRLAREAILFMQGQIAGILGSALPDDPAAE